MVEKLEILDKNNVFSIRREIVVLKDRLKECEVFKSEMVFVTFFFFVLGKYVIFLLFELGFMRRWGRNLGW